MAVHRLYARPPATDALDAWIVSPGGVATTALMEHCAHFMTINDVSDKDGLKHWPRPPRNWALLGGKQVLFLWGNPEAIHKSIARRGWVEIQSCKLGSAMGVFAAGEHQRRAFIKAVESQQNSWLKLQRENFRAIHYEDIWDAANDLASFFDVADPRFVKQFPTRKARLSAAA